LFYSPLNLEGIIMFFSRFKKQCTRKSLFLLTFVQ